METSKLHCLLILASVAAFLAACGQHGSSPEPQPSLPGLPQTAIGSSPALRKHSSGTYQVDVLGSLAQGGSNTRSEAASLVIAGDGDLAWALYGVAMTDPERPVSIDLAVSAGALENGGAELPVSFFVGLPDYTAVRWEWAGPFDSSGTVLLNSGAAPRNPRRVAPDDTLYFVVLAGSSTSAPLGPAALKIDTLTVNTSGSFAPMLPGAVFPTATAGNDKRDPQLPEDALAVSLHWTHLSAKSPADAVNIADMYRVFRRAPGRQFQEIGTIAAPSELYVDPQDNKSGAPMPSPLTEYDYYLLAENEQGSSGHNGFVTVQTGNLELGSAWATHRGNNARTGANPSMAINGVLQAQWSIQVQIGTQTERYEPVLVEGNDSLVTAGSVPRRYAATDGSEVDSWPGFTPLPGFNHPTVFGPWVAFPAETNGLNILHTGTDEVRTLEGAGNVWGSPLYLDGKLIFADKSGVVLCYDPFSGEQLWQFFAFPPSPFNLSAAASVTHVYAADNVGRVFKIEAATGALVDSVDLTGRPLGDAVALDEVHGLLWLATDEACLVAISIADMSVAQVWNDVPVLEQVLAPCVLSFADPPLVVTAYSIDNENINVLGVDPSMLATAWERELEGEPAYSISGCADAILLSKDNSQGGPRDEILMLSHGGEVLQRLETDGRGAGSAIPVDGHVYLPTRLDPYLMCFGTAPLTRPLWVDEADGEVGIRNWECLGEGEDRDDMRVSWYDAYHPDGLLVHYALFYSEEQPPMLEPPYTDTTIISGLTHSDSNSVQVHDVPLGTRYYASIRAYVGPWGENALTDLNTVWIGSTPPWKERAVAPGSSVLPSEDIGAFSLTPGESEAVYIVASEATGGKLWNFWRTFGSFDQEGSELNMFSADALAAAWGSQLFVARANAGSLGILKRNSKNSWAAETVLSGALPDDSPALSLAMGSESGLAYTHYVSGSEPSSEVDYYAVRHDGNGWGSPELVEPDNASGSDLDVALDPADPSKLWIAYQKGTVASGSLPTCTSGELWFAWGDGSGGYSTELVDAGSNGPDSDCGKRVKMVLDGSNPHLAYLDLNASASEPRGRLKHAYHDGANWQVATVAAFDTSTQLDDFRATYSELGFTLGPTGPVIALLLRSAYSSDPGTFTTGEAHIFLKDGSNWEHEVVSDPKPLLQKDREPCELVYTPNGYLDLFFVAPPDGSTLDPGRQIVFLRRQP